MSPPPAQVATSSKQTGDKDSTSSKTKPKTRSRVKPGMTEEEAPTQPAPTPAVNDTIRFASNTWRVLAVSKTDLLVLSDTLVADKLFADTPTNTYATSTLRTWLTTDYLTSAFTPAEQTTLKPTPLPDVDVTADKVFLLSVTEVNDLLTDPSAPTAWWLRSAEPYGDSYVTAINTTGSFFYTEAHTQPLSTRPALTLDLTQLELRPETPGLFIASPK